MENLHYSDGDCLFWRGENLFEGQYHAKVAEVWEAIRDWGAVNGHQIALVEGNVFNERKTAYEAFVALGGGLSPKCYCLFFSNVYWGNSLVLTPMEVDDFSQACYKVW